MRLLKISGHQLHDPTYLRAFASAVAPLPPPLVVVHGGGQAIAELHARLNVPTHKVDGLRVTDAPSLEIAELVLSGGVNKQLVRALTQAGLPAVGISGVDGGLLQARKKGVRQKYAAAPDRQPLVDYGFVGEIEQVNPQLIDSLLAAGFVPVVSPISLGADGQHYNVNADDAATALAVGLAATQIDFVSNVPGVMADMSSGVVTPQLTVAEVGGWIASGIIQGGMIPKVRGCVTAVAAGVGSARIVDLAGLASGGTLIVQNKVS